MITSSEPWNTTQSINEVISCCLEASGNSLMEAKNSLIQQLEYLAEIAPIWKRILDEVDPSMEAYMRRMPLSDEW